MGTGGPDAASTMDASAGLRFQLIGTFAAWRDGQRLPDRDVGSRKGRLLLQALLLAAEEPVRTGQLSEILWGAAPPDQAERNLASLVSRLRAVLGADAIEGGAGVYRLRRGPRLTTDLAEAEGFAEEATSRLAAGQPAFAATAAERGLELVGTGTVLEGQEGDWLEPARAALRVLRRDLYQAAWCAAFELDAPAQARELADAALRLDPLDEPAARASMLAAHQLGEPAAALRTYEHLRRALADELGVDPAPATRDLHLALLRDEAPPRPERPRPSRLPPSPRTSPPGFVARDRELEQLVAHWEAAAVEGQPSLVLLTGEAGIGKTRLAHELLTVVQAAGGACHRTRCHETERSHFLAAIVDLLADLGRQVPAPRLRQHAGTWAGTLADLVPELTPLLGPGSDDPSTAAVGRRRAFQAMTHLLCERARERPTLLFVDDLHHAGSSTIEFLHHLRRHAAGGLLVVATIRVEEGAEVLRELQDVAERIDVGPLPDPAVTALVRAAGAERFNDRIVSMTRGHTLSVVETLAALAEVPDDVAEPPVPGSLEVAVHQRIERAGAEVAELLRAAAVLGATFELPTAAGLLDRPVDEVARQVELAAASRLLVVDGQRLAFANELIQEIVYRSIPRPVRAIRHQRAAELLDDNPEAVGWHASAAGDWPRALASLLEAAQRAASRYANRDAERLLARAIDAGPRADDPIGTCRARLTRAIVREALADYRGALDDLEEAAELARANARPDLEAAALRQLGGDVIVGLGRPSTDCLPYLEVGLDVAERAQLGRIEVELMSRTAVLWSNRGRFDLAAQLAERGLVRARDLDDPRAVALALDAVKNVSAYTGDLGRLEDAVTQLEPLLRDEGDLALLQWCVFESAMAPLARGRWDAAVLVLERALALNRRTGHPWRSLFIAQRSWLHRVRGDLGEALADARTSLASEVSAGHPWWMAFGDVMLGWVLSDVGADEEAVDRLQEGIAAAERTGMETYLLRCVSHLALAAWRAGRATLATRCLERAESLLAGVRAPEGAAFLHGAHAYAAVARVRLARGDIDAAIRLLDVVRAPAEEQGWREVVATDRLLRGRALLLSDEPAGAYAALVEAAELAESAGMVPLAWEARAALGLLATASSDLDRVEHDDAAARHLEVMSASLPEPELRERLRGAAARRRAVASGEPTT